MQEPCWNTYVVLSLHKLSYRNIDNVDGKEISKTASDIDNFP